MAPAHRTPHLTSARLVVLTACLTMHGCMLDWDGQLGGRGKTESEMSEAASADAGQPQDNGASTGSETLENDAGPASAGMNERSDAAAEQAPDGMEQAEGVQCPDGLMPAASGGCADIDECDSANA